MKRKKPKNEKGWWPDCLLSDISSPDFRLFNPQLILLKLHRHQLHLKNQFLSKMYQFTSKNLTFHGLFYFWKNCKKVVDDNFDGLQGWTQSSLPLKKHTNCKLLLSSIYMITQMWQKHFENPGNLHFWQTIMIWVNVWEKVKISLRKLVELLNFSRSQNWV